MATVTRKRKATISLEDTTKRLRIEEPALYAYDHLQLDEDNDDDNEYQHSEISSGAGDIADTPVTPFSPARKKFPSEYKTIACSFEGCTKTFNRPARLTAHMRTHTNERPFICTYKGCDKSYFQEKHLQHHVKSTHTHERDFHCDWDGCSKSFLTSTRLKRHKETHTGHERFRCTAYPPCNQTFRKHNTLQRHIRSDHLQLSPYFCTYIDPITLEPCNAGFDGATGLRQHVQRAHQEPEYFCIDCIVPGRLNPDGTLIYQGFHSDAKLQVHIRKEHANCLFCDVKFSNQLVLQQHIESQHSGKSLEERKSIVCTFVGCNKRFTKQNNLKTHIRTAHNGERYICGTFDLSSQLELSGFIGCGNDLVSKQSLIDHVRTAHLGLPSVKKPSFISDSEAEHTELKKKSKNRSKKANISAIDELLGESYASDPRRNIACLVEDCPHKFIRNYDLEVHMSTAHLFPLSESYAAEQLRETSVTALGGQMDLEDDREELDAMYAQADLELQRRAMEGGQFWLGAEDPEYDGRLDEDEWTKEEREMRGLIDDEI